MKTLLFGGGILIAKFSSTCDAHIGDALFFNDFQFGTPEEVAARVVTAEVNRDGIFEVKLLEDPYETAASDGNPQAYILRYLSTGKRGNKILTNKIVVSPNNLLYVLTAQCKEDDFPAQEKEILRTVESFQIF